ncbi:hypothetical protein GOC46_28870 [Sinorhizobium meliloti]|nr:hypothetical protein [Sinorhizobium meliloti]MDX0384141.1 hypothetical protein [Sinorhizobium meliloti]
MATEITGRFFLKTSVTLLIYLVPVVLFAFLKYNGLEDTRGYADAANESVEGTSNSAQPESDTTNPEIQPTFSDSQNPFDTCISRIAINQFHEQFVASPYCATVICRNGQCGALVKSGSHTVTYADTPEMRSEINTAVADKEPRETRQSSVAHPQEIEINGTRASPTSDAEAQEKQTPAIVAYVMNDPVSGAVKSINSNKYGFFMILIVTIVSWTLFFSALGTISSMLPRAEGQNLSFMASRYPVFVTVAATSGILTLCLFIGGFVSGTLFPNFSSASSSLLDLSFRGADWFKMAIWAYISGFYERFIPSILNTLTTRATGDGPRGGSDTGEGANPTPEKQAL